MQNQRMSIKLEHIKHQLSNIFRNIFFSFYFPIITKNIILSIIIIMALLEKHDRKLNWRETLDFEVQQVQKKAT